MLHIPLPSGFYFLFPLYAPSLARIFGFVFLVVFSSHQQTQQPGTHCCNTLPRPPTLLQSQRLHSTLYHIHISWRHIYVVVVVVAIVHVQRKLNPQINHSCCNVTLFDCCLRLCRIYRVSLLPWHPLNFLRCTLALLIIVVFVLTLQTTFPFTFFSNI